ncbi:hypothetical protein DACRYDRAFT_15032 [Dacryopinax primogenitus]|uniref:DUF6532 domain-containing protein n=1 Tax=Dacryopinax primogenitus (strain DJM 731) TaxID=1858805 RepID=M5G343_DACPD|nr:uncharacterized protein DACRYDRAFT_15032 [Dacryopinax primogenitus]EJU03119.1 hypothetical protein DACRYDRAFT_15032 [Dacryopinax primogenitus]
MNMLSSPIMEHMNGNTLLLFPASLYGRHPQINHGHVSLRSLKLKEVIAQVGAHRIPMRKGVINHYWQETVTDEDKLDVQDLDNDLVYGNGKSRVPLRKPTKSRKNDCHSGQQTFSTSHWQSLATTSRAFVKITPLFGCMVPCAFHLQEPEDDMNHSSELNSDNTSSEELAEAPPCKSGSHAVMCDLSPTERSTVHGANQCYQPRIATENAFPSPPKSIHWVEECVEASCKAFGLSAQDHIEQRQAQLRGEVKTIPNIIVKDWYLFQFRTSDARAAEVVEPRQLYKHPAITDIFIHVYYKDKQSTGPMFKEAFASGHPAILALPIRALDCSLMQWETGEKAPSSSYKFSANGWSDIYYDHLLEVEKFKSTFPLKYKQIMSHLINKGLAFCGDISQPKQQPHDYVEQLIDRLQMAETEMSRSSGPLVKDQQSSWALHIEGQDPPMESKASDKLHTITALLLTTPRSPTSPDCMASHSSYPRKLNFGTFGTKTTFDCLVMLFQDPMTQTSSPAKPTKP